VLHTRPVSLGVLVTVAGIRWCVEECFQAAKNEAGMDHYQVRRLFSVFRPATSSTPATGHDGATTATNAPATSTTSDNDS
jgi:hypothetical protein